MANLPELCQCIKCRYLLASVRPIVPRMNTADLPSERRDFILPTALFPSTTSIRLGGLMQQEQVDSILSQAAPRITHLERHNVFQWSYFDSPLAAFTTHTDLHQYWKNNVDIHFPILATRPMSSTLHPYTGRCFLLTSLCIKTTGYGGYTHWQDENGW
jgi:hypothetical protein